MKKNPRPVSHNHTNEGNQQPGIPPARQPVSRSQFHVAPEEWVSSPQYETAFASLPDAALACDRDGKLFCINDAALNLFEISSVCSWLGMPYRELLQHYDWYDEQQRPTFLAPWLLNLDRNAAGAFPIYEQTLLLSLLSGRRVLLELRCAPLLDAEQQVSGMVFLLHKVTPRYQKALRLQRVSEAISTLNESIAQIPERFTFVISDEVLFLSPPVLFVVQKLVDVIHQVLACWRVSLVALEPGTHYLSYVVGSGFSAEQEQRRQELRGRFLSTEILDETLLTSLYANQEVILGSDRMHFPVGHPADFGAATLLIVPLFLEQQLAGGLIVANQGWGNGYSQEEIDFVKAVAAQSLLIIEWLGNLQKQARELVLYEVNHLIGGFLTLASHELRTPLTGIKGNLQLAQRRLERLKREMAQPTERISEHLEQTRQSLESAAQSAQLQERMVQYMIDDARIQADQLVLSLKPYDLLVLLKKAVEQQQMSVPGRAIKLENLTTGHTLPVLVDVGRIIQVLTLYLENALNYSPAERPVIVQVRSLDNLARVSVHDEGVGIPLEEQEHLWDRFYRGKGSAVQHELDLSLGLSFYLSQALIERHHGSVGVESEPGHGTTYWFSLPIAKSAHV